MSGQQYVLDVPRPDEWISANERTHWAVKARKTKIWRARFAAEAQHLPHMSRIHILAEIRNAGHNRRRDATNLAPTVKAAVDGLVDAGVIPDDNDGVITGTEFRNGEPASGLARLRLTITDLSTRCQVCGEPADDAVCERCGGAA
jgi:crossover junction endodeoxyribonuclease RusA